MKRFKPSRGKARKQFSKTAGRVHKFNTLTPIARGGTRL